MPGGAGDVPGRRLLMAAPVDVAIVGGGIVGLATAAALS